MEQAWLHEGEMIVNSDLYLQCMKENALMKAVLSDCKKNNELKEYKFKYMESKGLIIKG